MQCYSSLSPFKISLFFSLIRKKNTQNSRYDSQMNNVKLSVDCESTYDNFLLKERLSFEIRINELSDVEPIRISHSLSGRG